MDELDEADPVILGKCEEGKCRTLHFLLRELGDEPGACMSERNADDRADDGAERLVRNAESKSDDVGERTTDDDREQVHTSSSSCSA